MNSIFIIFYFVIPLLLASSAMMMTSSILLLISAFFLFSLPAFALNVSHDGRAITIDGERRILFSGSIHYPRSTPGVSSNHNYCVSFFLINVLFCTIFFAFTYCQYVQRPK
jgi:hypothetical protein